MVTVESPMWQHGVAKRPFGYLVSLLRAYIKCAGVRPCLFVADGWRAVPYAVPLARLLGARVVLHIHHTDTPPSRITQALGGMADFITMVSRWQQAHFAATGLLRPGRNRVVNVGIESAAFLRATGQRASARGQLGLGADEIALVLTGFILPRKGGDVLLEAARLLANERPGLRFFFLGGPMADTGSAVDRAYPEKLKARCRQLGLEDCVTFLGHREGIASLLCGMDIAVVPTVDEEAFGRVSVEAMLSQLPVVASRSGGLPEVVLDGETGLIVPKCDPSALAAALRRLIDDPALRLQMGQAGRQRALTCFEARRKDREMWTLLAEVGR